MCECQKLDSNCCLGVIFGIFGILVCKLLLLMGQSQQNLVLLENPMKVLILIGNPLIL